MLLTPHILAGVAVFSSISNPALGLFLAFLSHYFLDCFPQKEYSIENIRERRWRKSLPDFLKVFSDIILGFLIVFLITGYNPLILAAAFIAILPDGLTMLTIIFNKNGLLKKHGELHATVNAFCENKGLPVFWGVFSQVAVIALAIFFLLQ